MIGGGLRAADQIHKAPDRPVADLDHASPAQRLRHSVGLDEPRQLVLHERHQLLLSHRLDSFEPQTVDVDLDIHIRRW